MYTPSPEGEDLFLAAISVKLYKCETIIDPCQASMAGELIMIYCNISTTVHRPLSCIAWLESVGYNYGS